MSGKKYQSGSQSSSPSSNDAPGDCSNKTVVFMLALFILVGVVGFVMYLDALEQAEPKVVLNGGTASGKVQITLLPPEAPTGQVVAKVPVKSSKAVGKVAIKLQQKNQLQQLQ